MALFGRIDQTGHVSVRVFVLVHELVGVADFISAKRARQTGIDLARDDIDGIPQCGPDIIVIDASGHGVDEHQNCSFFTCSPFWHIEDFVDKRLFTRLSNKYFWSDFLKIKN